MHGPSYSFRSQPDLYNLKPVAMSRKTLHCTLLLLSCTLLFIENSPAQSKRAQQGKLLSGTPGRGSNPDKRPQFPPLLHTPFRSFNGSGNNISSRQALLYGATDIPLFREIPAQYGSEDPNNAMAGKTRPSARRISNAVIDEPVTTFNARGLSAFVYVWGQFLDHDMSLTPTGTTEYVPISLPADEKIFTEAIPFFRSEVYTGTGAANIRQQMNLNTAWIDASMVYGSDSARAHWLRTMSGGKMKLSAGGYLPYNTVNGEKSGAIDPDAPDMANDSNHAVRTFVAGDIRAAEHPGIASLHTLFVREHNKICDRLKQEGYNNDELIYQMARKLVGALIQSITYKEFLPAIGITLNRYNGYRSNIRADIVNNFATAGYRIGHTMVADDILLFDNNCKEIAPGELDLVEVFWNPQILIDFGPEAFLKGFAAHTQYETDTKINSVLRNFLFVSPNDPVRFGIDLGSLNIQRGRDHGLPDYNTVRKFYTGSKARSFSDITNNKTLADSLKALYTDINNIDLWVGILAEDHLPGKSVGRTMHEILRVQFEKLRDGDYYYYENDPLIPTKTKKIIAATHFSDIIKRNTNLTNLQANVFFTEECPEDSMATGDSVAARKITNLLSVKKTGESVAHQIQIFPNPANSVLNIDLGNGLQNSIVKIVTADGVPVKTFAIPAQQQYNRVDISGLKPGLYLVTVYTGKEIKTFKLSKLAN